MNGNNLIKAAIVVIIGVIIWFIPTPSGVSKEAWHLFAIVLATIIGLILQPIPIGAVAFIGVTVAILTKVMKPAEALTGFASG